MSILLLLFLFQLFIALHCYFEQRNKRFSLILIADKHGGIANNDDIIPFSNSHDLRNFKKLTENHIVIMGRKTWDSIPHKPLKNRINIILSTTLVLPEHNSNVYVVKNMDECMKLCRKFSNKEWFVIGGEQIYKLFFNKKLCNKIHYSVCTSDVDFKCTKFFHPVNYFQSHSYIINEKDRYIYKDKEYIDYEILV